MTRTNLAVAPTDWMAQLPGHLLLTELTLPGTHDSGTYPGYGGASPTCQTMTIAQQLESGIRVLDIRCVQTNDEFWIHHSNVCEYLRFKTDVRQVCLDFLAKHPGETIVMSIKHEENGELDYNNTKTFEQLVQELLPPDICYPGQEVPELGRVRGKIVLLRRYTPGQVLGPFPSVLKAVAAGGDGSVWGIDAVGAVHRLEGSTFVPVTGVQLAQIAVGADGAVWGLDGAGVAHAWNGSTFTPQGGAYKRIAVGRGGMDPDKVFV